MSDVRQTPIDNLSSQFFKVANKQADASFKDSDGPMFDEYLEITSDSAIIIGDAEVPDHDPELFGMAADLAEKYNIKLLIINGDFLHADKFSQFKMRNETKGIPFCEEVELIRFNLNGFLKHFDRIAMLSGNHEQRLSKMSNGHINLSYFVYDINNILFSEYMYLWLNTNNGRYFVCHPQNYSRIPLSTSREIAAIRHSHVVCAHNHHLSMSRDRSGQYWILDGGCCRDISKTQYKQMAANTFPQWVPGFTMILDGVPFLVSKEHYKMFI